MKVQHILSAKGQVVETIRPDAPLELALHRLAAKEIGAQQILAKINGIK